MASPPIVTAGASRDLSSRNEILPDRRRHRGAAARARWCRAPTRCRPAPPRARTTPALPGSACVTASRSTASRVCARRGMRPVAGLGAQHFDVRGGVVGRARVAQQRRVRVEDRLAGAPRLGHRVDADDGELGGAAKPSSIRRTRPCSCAVGARPRAPRTSHAVLAGLLACVTWREVADHVGQQVGGGVADLVQHLLARPRPA